MIAYFVHDKKTKQDTFVLPDAGCQVKVTPERFEKFISVDPDFSQWTGDACGDLVPADFGTIVASRQDKGDVCIFEDELWRERMFFHMNSSRE